MRAVLFDLDRTLWYSPTPPDFDHITRLQAAAIAPLYAHVGTDAFVRAFWSEWQRRDDDRANDDLAEIDWLEVMQVACSSVGESLSTPDARLAWEAVNAVPRSAFNTEACPGAVDALRTLKARGWRTAIVTNYPLEAGLLRPHLDWCGLLPYIDVVVTSVDTMLRKPHAQPFHNALAALDAKAEQSLMVGDSYATDIAPALSLGMMGVHLSTDGSLDVPSEVTRIASLEELPALLGDPS